jgi:hypothetical protein
MYDPASGDEIDVPLWVGRPALARAIAGDLLLVGFWDGRAVSVRNAEGAC